MNSGIQRGVENPILQDYYQHLNQLEEKVSVFRTSSIDEWTGFA
jgi:hypothetical protein